MGTYSGIRRGRRDRLHREQWPLSTLPARVTNEPGTPAGNDDRVVTATLEVGEQHQGAEVADGQTVGRGVESDVGAPPPRREVRSQSRRIRRLMQQAAPLKLVEEVVHGDRSYRPRDSA